MNKKKGIGGKIAVGVIIALIGFALCTILVVTDGAFAFGGKMEDFSEYVTSHGGNLESGDHVKLEVEFVLGNYAEMKHKINGFIPAGKDQYYVLVLSDGSVVSYMTKNKKLIKELDEAAEEFWDYYDGYSSTYPSRMELSGEIKTIDTQIYTFYKQTVTSVGLTSDSTVTVYYMGIDGSATRLRAIFYILICFLVGVAGVVSIFVTIGKSKKVNNAEAALANVNAQAYGMAPTMDPLATPVQPTPAVAPEETTNETPNE